MKNIMQASKQLLLAVIVLSSVFLSSCSMIFTPKSQKVSIHTGSRNAKVYLDDEYVGKGKTVQAKVKRDLNAHQVRVEKEGYKNEYGVLGQSKRNVGFYFSIFPGTLLYFLPPIFDAYSPKSFNYNKEWSVKPKTKILERGDEYKYIYVKNTSFEVDADDVKVESYSIKTYLNNKDASRVSTSEEDVDVDNSIFDEALNSTLYDYGFIDTTETIFKSKGNTLYINSTVSKIKFYNIRIMRRFQSYVSSKTTIKWELLDVYGQVIHSEKIASKSGEFCYAYTEEEGSDYNSYITASIEDAIKVSFFKFLNKPEVQKHLDIEKDLDEEKLSTLSLKKPAPITSLANAQKATVTIKNGDDSHGSGCFISNDGYVVTNFHVVANADENLTVIDNEGKEYAAKLIRNNLANDLALIKIDAEIEHAFTVPSKEIYEFGEDIFAIGTPESIELGQTLSKGIVSGVRKQNNVEWIQSDVSVNAGNSGGAMVNKKGELIGIVNSKLVGFGVEGISFSIPANLINNFLSVEYK